MASATADHRSQRIRRLALGRVGARHDFDVVAGARTSPARPTRSVAIDITDAASVRAAFDEARPDVRHAPGGAVGHRPLRARARNWPSRSTVRARATWPANVPASRRGCCSPRPTRCSTARKRIYHEDDPPTPVNWYGRDQGPRRAGDRRTAALGRDRAAFAGAGAFGARREATRISTKSLGNLRAGNRSSRRRSSFAIRSTSARCARFLLGADAEPRRHRHFSHRRSDKMSRYDLARAHRRALGL